MTEANYDKPELREKIKNRIKASSNGAAKGQWSAIKSNILAKEYKEAGGVYKSGKTKAQKALQKWNKDDWQYSDGSKSGNKGRFRPKETWDKLTKKEKDSLNQSKYRGNKQGKQFVPIPKKLKDKVQPSEFSWNGLILEFAKIRPNMVLKKVNVMRGGKRTLGRRWFKKNEPLALPGKEIGKGKVSKVFEVADGVAYKSYKAGSDSKILEREAANLKYLNEKVPGIAPKYISHNENGIAMERVGGNSLEKYLKDIETVSPFPNKEIAKLGEKVGEVLGQIHSKDFVHGDLTENNIVVDAKGKIRLLNLEDSKIFKPSSQAKYSYFDEDIEVLLGGIPGTKVQRQLFMDGFFKTYKKNTDFSWGGLILEFAKVEKEVKVKSYRTKSGSRVNPFKRRQKVNKEETETTVKPNNLKNLGITAGIMTAALAVPLIPIGVKAAKGTMSDIRIKRYQKAATKALPAPTLGSGVYGDVQGISESQVGKVFRPFSRGTKVTVDANGIPNANPIKLNTKPVGQIIKGRDKEYALLKELSDTGVTPKPIKKNRFGFTMEKVEGESLHSFVHSTLQNPTDEQLLELGSSVGAALKKVHEKGILHGDLHSNNIMLDNKGNIKIIDFGLGRKSTYKKGSPSFLNEIAQDTTRLVSGGFSQNKQWREKFAEGFYNTYKL
jgi:tRNA A-37 threonylcarbamoyl transferase component Bud32